MRPPQRGSGPSFMLAISCLASLYVFTRLWASSSEVAHWRSEVARLYALAEEQRLLLARTDEAAPRPEEEFLFFSVRPAPRGAPIEPLTGISLDSDGLAVTRGNGSLLATIDTVEAGAARGWACGGAAPDGLALRVVLYVDGVRAASVDASDPIDAPDAALVACAEAADGGAPRGFEAALPPLAAGVHELRAFAVPAGGADGAKQELLNSPLRFRESVAQPDAEAVIRRKDAIIVRRNAQLVAMWSEANTHAPWRAAAAEAGGETAAAAALANSSQSGGGERLLAVVLVHSDAGAAAARAAVRATWAPGGAAAAALRSHLGVVVRFVVGAAPGARDQSRLLAEQTKHGDVFVIAGGGGGSGAEAQRTLEGLAAAAAGGLDADFYALTRDDVAVNAPALAAFLGPHRVQGNLYAGCQRSGAVVTADGARWYEPEHWRFGDASGGSLQYPRHAGGDFFALSRHVALYLARNRAVLRPYANSDVSVGAWLLGLDVQHVDERRLCCRPDGCHAGAPPAAACVAVAGAGDKLAAVFDECVRGDGGGAGQERARR